MKARFKFEFFRVFNITNLPFFIALFIASLYLGNLSISEHTEVQQNNKKFSSLEKQKSTQVVTYEQYGVFGYKIKGEADPLIIFFNHSTPLNDLESKIDAMENVNIGSSVKGKAIFKKTSHFKDLFGLLNVFGTLLMFLMGLFSYKPQAVFMEKKRSLLNEFIPRLFWLNAFFSATMSSIFIFALLKGVPFTVSHAKLYVLFQLNIILLLDVCFVAGFFIASGIKSRYMNISITIIVWFFCIFILPEWQYPNIQETDVLSEFEIDLIKNENLMAKEKAIREAILPLLRDSKRDPKETWLYQKNLVMEYLNDGYIKNNALEYKLQGQMKNIVEQLEKKSLWNPFDFNLLISETLSSRGYRYYLNFVDHVLEKKDRFFRYYIDKRYNSKDPAVIPLTTEGDFIYKSQSLLPHKFWPGIAMQFCYLLFLSISLQVFLHLKEKRNTSEKKTMDLDQIKNAYSFFWECKENDGLEKYLNFFKTTAGITVIDTRSISASGLDTPLISWIRYVCDHKKYQEQTVLHKLEKLGIPLTELKKKHIAFKTEAIKKNAEKLKTVYLVLKSMEESNLLVIYNFFKGETQEFEDNCKKYLAQSGKRVLYISSEGFRQKVKSFKLIKSLDIYDENISLR
ncbi:MAG TPA: hypothetical protein VK469_13160 [Candidatus Kapabacteria bacterium]|nr:hypothetical protein [Candidatus Kapabacteria bacterium]